MATTCCLACRAEGEPLGGEDEPCVRCGAATRLRGRWRVLGPLARGGSARVFRGHDTLCGRDVALKVLDLADVEDWKQVELFERQLPLLRQLKHRGIPTVHDSFQQPSGGRTLFVLVQSLHRGPNLRDALADGLRFDEAAARMFLGRMLDILDYLHGFSPPILHRDIKPANILLELPDGSDANTSLAHAQPILIDFDTARGGAVDLRAADGTMVGSAGFVPMEQLAGRPVPASDLYGLGMTMIAALSQRDVLDLPVERSRLQFHDFVNVSRELTHVLDKLVAPIVEDRFQDVGSVRRALAATSNPSAKLRAELGPDAAARVAPRRRVSRGLKILTLAAGPALVWAAFYSLRGDAPSSKQVPRSENRGALSEPRPARPLEPSCELSFDTSCATSLRGDDTYFGRHLALSGDTLVTSGDPGAARVYARIGSEWVEQVVLAPRDRDRRGAVIVALDGDTLAVTVPGAQDRFPYSGATYVYVRDGGWIQQAYLEGARENARIDRIFALSGDTLVTVEEESVAPDRSELSIVELVRHGQTWTRTDPQLPTFRWMGMAFDGDTLVVSESNVTHIFVRDAERWALQATLDVRGYGVALDGDTLAVRHVDEIRIFTRSGSTWAEEAVVRDPVPEAGLNPAIGRKVGEALALKGDVLAASVYSTNYNVDGYDEKPEVFLFARSRQGETVTWRPYRRITVPIVQHGHLISLALDRETLAVGTTLRSEDFGSNGAVFLLRP